jgi:hypothetical protein
MFGFILKYKPCYIDKPCKYKCAVKKGFPVFAKRENEDAAVYNGDIREEYSIPPGIIT